MSESVLCWLIPLTIGVVCAYLGYQWGKQEHPPVDLETVDRERFDKVKEENFHLSQDLEISQNLVRSLEKDLMRAHEELREKPTSRKAPVKAKSGSTSAGNENTKPATRSRKNKPDAPVTPVTEGPVSRSDSNDRPEDKTTSAEPAKKSRVFDADRALREYGKRVKENDLKIVEGIGPKIEEHFNRAGIQSWDALSETPVERLKEILDEAGSGFRMHDPTTWPAQAKMAASSEWKELATWQEASKSGKV